MKKSYLRPLLAGICMLGAMIVAAQVFNNFGGGFKPFPVKDPYKQMWSEVDSLETAGLTESANKVVKRVMDLAEREKNSVQKIKAFMHLAKYRETLEEDAFPTTLTQLDEMIARSSDPLRQILYSIRGEVIWNYYQQDMWTVNQRTPILDDKEPDIEKWDSKRFAHEAMSSFEASLKNEKELQKISLDDYKELLLGDSTYRTDRHTLYDFLMHRAINFYSSSYLDMLEPAEKFELEEDKYFKEAAGFVKITSAPKDSLSSLLKAIHLFQQLTAFHQKDADPSALVQLEINRLNFIRSKSVHDDKTNLYIQALTNLSLQYKDGEDAADISYALAKAYVQESVYWSALSKETYLREYKKKALEICNKVISTYPGTDGANNCELLKKEIIEPALSIHTQKATLPQAPVMVSVSYRNTDKILIKVYKHDYDKVKSQLANNEYEEAYKASKSGTLVKTYTFPLKAYDDHFDHTTEIALDPLELGFYTLSFSSLENDNDSNSYNGFASLWSTQLSVYNLTSYYSATQEFKIVHRQSGELVKGAQVNVFRYKYNYTTYTYDEEKVKTLKTGKDGTALEAFSNDSYFLDIHKGKDRFVTEAFYAYSYDGTVKPTEEVRFFLDRGLYRPGQTVNFKLLAVKNSGEDFHIRPGKKIQVIVYDINQREILKQEVTTNEYGTASGSFVLPSQCATGGWTVSCEDGSAYFQVEEYKRPKFEVKIDSIPGSYSINDLITIRGNAKALANFGIDNAKVTYRIDRLTQMRIYDWGYYSRYPSASKTIATGNMKTDSKGEFEFSFTAIPDTKVPLDCDPYFTYTVTVDVTDLSGETRSASFPVIVGYKTMEIGVSLPYYLDKTDTNSYPFYAMNLSGFTIHTTGTYEIRKLIVPDPYLVDRSITAPDEPVMTEAEFKKKFPHTPYKDENTVEKWAKGNMVSSGSFDTKNKTKLNKSTWSQLGQGWYVVITKAKDSHGKEVEQEYRFMVYDKKEKAHPFGHLMTVLPIKTSINKGENAEILIGTAAENIKVHISHEYKGKILKTEIITLNKEQKLWSLPVAAEPNMPYILHFAVVKDNYLYTTSQYIYTYDTTRNIELELVTFRDKMLPGASEDWKVKLTGNNKQNIAQAEILATMYDASLDLMAYNQGWNYLFYNSYSNYHYFGYNMFNVASQGYGYNRPRYDNKYYKVKSYEYLNYFGWYTGNSIYDLEFSRGYGSIDGYMWDYAETESNYDGDKMMNGKASLVGGDYSLRTKDEEKNAEVNAPVAGQTIITRDQNGASTSSISQEGTGFPEQTKVRSNFSETAFFYPHLVTNEKGESSFSFKVPESLTKWKFRALAITKDLRAAYLEKEMVTKKEVMITAFAPRFMREGDKIFYSAKVTNLTDADLNGTASIEIKDAISGKVISLVAEGKTSVAYTLKAGESKKVEWYFQVPMSLQAVTVTVKAVAGNHTDGEEITLPVLSNRILVTESVPIQVRGDSTKSFVLKNLVNANSATLTNERLTLEVTSNPAWYAIQALPYMMEYPYECAEQTFNRYYANVIGAHIANSDPRISKVFEVWKNFQPDALLSNLEKNQELKNILIEETPWLRDAKDETERKRRLGILFDLSRMKTETTAALDKLQNMQLPNGGFPWFAGGKDNRYITQYIISGLGHLRKLGIVSDDQDVVSMLTNGIHYLDNQITNDYKDLLKYKTNLELYTVSSYQVQYLYARSFFKDIDVNEKDEVAYNYFFNQSAKYWTTQSMSIRGMIALVHYRSDKKEFAQSIVKSLKENSIRSDEMGMYWKQTSTWYWYEAPIENQALMIEVFDEVTNDQVAVEELKIWLLKNKQTNDWKTTKATADACYALLLKGTSLLADDPEIVVTLGDKKVSTSDPSIKKEVGTGYIKYTFDKADIKPAMGNITMAKKGKGISWGAVYWQYMENIDKIPASFNQLQVVKKLYRQKYTSTGTILEAITDNTPLKIGERLVVRLELKVDRDMEFVHIKDMRASSLEPENVLSGYKYRERLAYYESTKDAATNFFVEFMPKGTYIFEYNLRVTHAGEFSNGLTTIQCMYAPEFTSHTAGINIKTVEE